MERPPIRSCLRAPGGAYDITFSEVVVDADRVLVELLAYGRNLLDAVVVLRRGSVLQQRRHRERVSALREIVGDAELELRAVESVGEADRIHPRADTLVRLDVLDPRSPLLAPPRIPQ